MSVHAINGGYGAAYHWARDHLGDASQKGVSQPGSASAGGVFASPPFSGLLQGGLPPAGGFDGAAGVQLGSASQGGQNQIVADMKSFLADYESAFGNQGTVGATDAISNGGSIPPSGTLTTALQADLQNLANDFSSLLNVSQNLGGIASNAGTVSPSDRATATGNASSQGISTGTAQGTSTGSPAADGTLDATASGGFFHHHHHGGHFYTPQAIDPSQAADLSRSGTITTGVTAAATPSLLTASS